MPRSGQESCPMADCGVKLVALGFYIRVSEKMSLFLSIIDMAY